MRRPFLIVLVACGGAPSTSKVTPPAATPPPAPAPAPAPAPSPAPAPAPPEPVAEILPAGCEGAKLDLDALVTAGTCDVASAAHGDAPSPKLELAYAPHAIKSGHVITGTATLTNETDAPLWLEIERDSSAYFNATLALVLARPPLGTAVDELPPGAPKCDAAVLGLMSRQLLRVRLAPHGRATVTAKVSAIGYPLKPDAGGCYHEGPLAPGDYELRGQVALSGKRRLSASVPVRIKL